MVVVLFDAMVVFIRMFVVVFLVLSGMYNCNSTASVSM